MRPPSISRKARWTSPLTLSGTVAHAALASAENRAGGSATGVASFSAACLPATGLLVLLRLACWRGERLSVLGLEAALTVALLPGRGIDLGKGALDRGARRLLRAIAGIAGFASARRGEGVILRRRNGFGRGGRRSGIIDHGVYLSERLRLARIPAKWNCFADKDSRQISMLEQISDHDHFRSLRSEVMNVIEILSWRVIGRKTGFHFS